MTDQWQSELEDRQKQRDFERYKFDREIESKEKEGLASTGHGLRLTAAQATVAASLLTLLGGTFGTAIQWKTANDTEQIKGRAGTDAESIKASGQLEIEKEKSRATIELERKKFETTLILKAVESDDENERIRNLKFYLKAGFITDPDGKVAAIKPDEYPSNPAKIPSPFTGTDLSDPAFSAYPKPLIELMRKHEGQLANIAALQSAVSAVGRLVKVSINENQKSALTSLVYNIGTGRFSTSNLLADLNGGRSDRILADFLELVPRSGPFSKGLEARRRTEAELFLAPE